MAEITVANGSFVDGHELVGDVVPHPAQVVLEKQPAQARHPGAIIGQQDISRLVASLPGNLIDVVAAHCQQPAPRQGPLSEEVKSALVVVVWIVDVAVVLALVRLLVVVAVETVYVVVGLDVVHQEGLFVVGKQVEVAVDLGGAVVVLVLAQEDPVYVVGLGVVEKAGQVADAAVRVAVPVIVVVHQLPVDGAVGQPAKWVSHM